MSLLRNSIQPVTRKFQRRLNVNTIDQIWAADLIDMQAFSKDKILANCNLYIF